MHVTHVRTLIRNKTVFPPFTSLILFTYHVLLYSGLPFHVFIFSIVKFSCFVLNKPPSLSLTCTKSYLKQAIIDAASYVPPPPSEAQKKKIVKM